MQEVLTGEQETRRGQAMLKSAMVLCASWAVFAAWLIILVRLQATDLGRALELMPVMRVVTLALAVMLAWPAAQLIRSANAAYAVLTPLLVVAALLVVLVLTTSAPSMILDVLVAAIIVAGLYSLRSGQFDTSLTRTDLLACLAGVALALGHWMVLLDTGYAHPLAEELALAGLQHKDTLFHAAIAGLAVYADTVSIGMDGLQPLNYHALSHHIIGSVASWAGVSPLDGYSLFVPIIGLPVLFFLTCVAAIPFSRDMAQPPSPVLAVLAIAAIAAVNIRLGGASVWVSESYIVSLWILMAAIQVLGTPPSKAPGHVSVTIVVLALLVLLGGMAKISTGAVMACGIAFWVAFRNGFHLINLALGAGMVLIPAALIAYASSQGAADPSQGGLLAPFAIYTQYQKDAIRQTVLLLGLMALIGLYLPRLWHERMNAFAVLIMMAAALTVFALVNLPAGAAFYFIGAGLWAATPLVLLLDPLPRWISGRSALTRTVVFFIATVVLILVDKDNLRAGPALEDDIAELTSRVQAADVQKLAQATVFGRIIERAAAHADIDGVFVEPTHEAFWTGHEICWASSLVLPAFLARPMLLGMHPEDSGCELTRYYGWSDYDRAVSSSADLALDDLCLRAAKRGMSVIAIARSNGEFEIVDVDRCQLRTEAETGAGE